MGNLCFVAGKDCVYFYVHTVFALLPLYFNLDPKEVEIESEIDLTLLKVVIVINRHLIKLEDFMMFVIDNNMFARHNLTEGAIVNN